MLSMDEIYQRYAQSVYRYLLSRTGNADLSEELTQETFYQAVRSIQSYDGSCKITTWLFGIAHNVLLTDRRKRPPLENIDDQIIPTQSAEEEALSAVSHMNILISLHRLPEPQREILYLRLFGGLSFREIGVIFGKNENWARVNYYRGKERLRKEVNEDDK